MLSHWSTQRQKSQLSLLFHKITHNFMRWAVYYSETGVAYAPKVTWAGCLRLLGVSQPWQPAQVTPMIFRIVISTHCKSFILAFVLLHTNILFKCQLDPLCFKVEVGHIPNVSLDSDQQHLRDVIDILISRFSVTNPTLAHGLLETRLAQMAQYCILPNVILCFWFSHTSSNKTRVM